MTSSSIEETKNSISTIGEIICAARINHQMTTEELAHKLDLTEKEILFMEEYGHIHISYNLLEKVSKTFNYNLDLLIYHATLQLERELNALKFVQLSIKEGINQNVKMDILSVAFGELLRYARLEKKYTLRDCSLKSGFSQVYLSTLERGGVPKIPSEVIEKLSNVLDYDLARIGVITSAN